MRIAVTKRILGNELWLHHHWTQCWMQNVCRIQVLRKYCNKIYRKFLCLGQFYVSIVGNKTLKCLNVSAEFRALCACRMSDCSAAFPLHLRELQTKSSRTIHDHLSFTHLVFPTWDAILPTMSVALQAGRFGNSVYNKILSSYQPCQVVKTWIDQRFRGFYWIINLFI